MIGSYPFENIYIKSFELPQKKTSNRKKTTTNHKVWVISFITSNFILIASVSVRDEKISFFVDLAWIDSMRVFIGFIWLEGFHFSIFLDVIEIRPY